MTKVLESAYRHGLTKDEILYAWDNLLRNRQRNGTDDPPTWIAIGVLRDGSFVELIGYQDLQGEWNIYHAFKPPTKKFLKELGFTDRS